MRFLRQSLIGLFLAALALGLLAYAGQTVFKALQSRMADGGHPAPARERVFAVSLRTARLQTVSPVLQAFGKIQSRRTLELRAAVGGRVVWLSPRFEEGGRVAAGEVLVRMDPADAQAALARAESDLQDARAEIREAARALELARDELDAAEDQADLRARALKRQKDLRARGVGTEAAVEAAELSLASARQAVLARRLALAQAEARVDKARTRLARAQITLDTARRTLDDTTIRAAFDGRLSGVRVVEGRLVAPNEKLADLVDPDQLEVAFRISTRQYVRLLGDDGRLIPAPVRVSLEAGGTDLVAQGVIDREGAAAGEGQSGRLIFARLENAPAFKPGDFVAVSVQEPPVENVARLPASALDARGTVLVIGEGDRLQALPVELVRRQGDDVLVRGEGLDGREVVIGRTPLLGPGIRVRPLRERSEAAVPETVPGALSAPGGARRDAMLELSDERRARLVAFVRGNARMPAEARRRLLDQLAGARVPAQLVARIEARMGGQVSPDRASRPGDARSDETGGEG